VREVVLEMGLLDAAEVDEILSPENLMNPRYHGRLYETVPANDVIESGELPE